MWYMILPIEYGHVHEREIPANTIRTIRAQLGVTQTALAAMLSVSPKAIQSYEQGWRKLPWHLLSQMLMLLALQREKDQGRPPCWEISGCSRQGQAHCPSARIGGGRYCWLVAGTKCGRRKATGGRAVPCETCVVIARLLQGATRPERAARPMRRAARSKDNLSGRSRRKLRSAEKSEVTS